ncbi:MAG: LptF/LptG family permease [Bacteroidota bacterium]
MKTIDRLLIKSFVAPFIVTFFIALFVLIMQFLWTYIDDIVGKGVSFLMLMELLSYLSISLVPTAFPIAILISSVMVMGNLAERYELASFKSAGVPLLRVMQPLMWVTLLISLASYITANNIIPVSNLQFKSRLYDIRKQKPALALETGVFNDDFKNLIIHIGAKGSDNRSIEDVLIYDHNNYNRGKAMMILAKKGEMYTTQDQRFFVMNLKNGTQYQETQQTIKGKDKTYPFVRTSFTEWTKVLDLSEFEINETNKKLFKSHHSMLSSSQLRVAIDSIDIKIDKRYKAMSDQIGRYFSSLKVVQPVDSSQLRKQQEAIKKDSLAAAAKKAQKNSRNPKNGRSQLRKSSTKEVARLDEIQKPIDDITALSSFAESLKVRDRVRFVNRAKSSARSIHGQADTANSTIDRERESRVKHVFELNIKKSMALACFIFLFIGAPMGAIVRKGGFGYPILIAIIFFMLYIVLNIFCKKLAESFVLPATLAAWTPCCILFPIGLTLTYRAMNDSKVVNTERYSRFFAKIFRRRNALKTA